MANNDWRDYEPRNDVLAHSWGTSSKQKAREREYNHDYWERNRERLMAARRRVRDATGLAAMERRNNARGLYNDARERRDYDESMLREARNQQNRAQEFWGYDSEQAERAAEGVSNATNMRDYSVEYEVLKKQDLDRLEQEYGHTPLGQIENASKNTINAVSNALENVKDITINILNNVVDLVRKR